MRQTIAALMCLLLARPVLGQGADPSIQQKVVMIPLGSPIELRLKNNVRLRGRLDQVFTDSFEIKIAMGDRVETRQIGFADVKSLKQIKEGKGMNLLAGFGLFMIIFMTTATIITAAQH